MFSNLPLFHNENCSHCKAQQKFQVIYCAWTEPAGPICKTGLGRDSHMFRFQHLEHSQKPEICSIVITEQD